MSAFRDKPADRVCARCRSVLSPSAAMQTSEGAVCPECYDALQRSNVVVSHGGETHRSDFIRPSVRVLLVCASAAVVTLLVVARLSGIAAAAATAVATALGLAGLAMGSAKQRTLVSMVVIAVAVVVVATAELEIGILLGVGFGTFAFRSLGWGITGER